MKSLERRLIVGLSSILLLVFIALFWASTTVVRTLAEAHILTRLEHDAEALVAALELPPNHPPGLVEGRITPIYQQPLSGHYFVFAFDTQDTLRSRSLWDEQLALDTLEPGRINVGTRRGPSNQTLLVRTAGYEKGGQKVTLLVAEDLTPMERQIEHMQWSGLGLLAIALLCVVLFQRYILRRGFMSLDQVRTEIQQVTSGRQQQIDALGPSEVRPLTTEINRLLSHQQQRLQRSRHALGNLAHGLKAPLSLLTRDIETLPLAQDERQRLVERLMRISVLIDRELKRARIAGEGAGQYFHPSRHIPELIEALEQLHKERNIDIAVGELPDVALPLDYEDMLELLGNLLDNACKWATGRVELTIDVNHDVTCVVADDGAGIQHESRAALLERGSRLDEETQGHGLGLAIVKNLIDDYGGRIEFARSTNLGGFEVRVHLPLR